MAESVDLTKIQLSGKGFGLFLLALTLAAVAWALVSGLLVPYIQGMVARGAMAARSAVTSTVAPGGGNDPFAG